MCDTHGSPKHKAQAARPALSLSVTCKWFSALQSAMAGWHVGLSWWWEWVLEGEAASIKALSLVLIKPPNSTGRKWKITIVSMNIWQSRGGNWEEMRWNTREWCIGKGEWKPVKNGNTWKAVQETSLTCVQETCSSVYTGAVCSHLQMGQIELFSINAEVHWDFGNLQ